MAIATIQAFLVDPSKAGGLPICVGNDVALSGKVFDLLQDIFISNNIRTEFEITFNPNAAGKQQNDFRDSLIFYHAAPSVATATPLAEKLSSVTDQRSGKGLLFLMTGTSGPHQRVVVSRFPAKQAILAEVGKAGLGVEFLDQVFIRNVKTYKSIRLEAVNPAVEFWTGMVTDLQAGGGAENISEYWIKDFLTADFTETPTAGTRRLANALKAAAKKSNATIKTEIAAAVSLASNLFAKKVVSIDDFCKQVGFSKATIDAVVSEVKKSSLASKQFIFSASDFRNVLPYRTVEMNSGAILTAPSGRFEEVFSVRDMGLGVKEYSTEGRIRDERVNAR
ncbi:MAG TPA: hypothetical protein VFG34_04670 [Sphingopyxis sp.]|nr:hypothetical protein [Sphingopyxis sp.]